MKKTTEHRSKKEEQRGWSNMEQAAFHMKLKKEKTEDKQLKTIGWLIVTAVVILTLL